MSAGAGGELAFEPVPMSCPATRPPLRLVASNGALRHGGRVGCREDAFCEERPAIRLTRRGRLVLAAMATLAAVTLAMVLASTVDAAAPVVDHVTTVSAGLTLSEIAATQLPSLAIQDGVARIQLANGMNTSQVHAGQLLLIPALP